MIRSAEINFHILIVKTTKFNGFALDYWIDVWFAVWYFFRFSLVVFLKIFSAIFLICSKYVPLTANAVSWYWNINKSNWFQIRYTLKYNSDSSTFLFRSNRTKKKKTTQINKQTKEKCTIFGYIQHIDAYFSVLKCTKISRKCPIYFRSSIKWVR